MSIYLNIKKRIQYASRNRKVRDFYTLAKNGETILDAGVSPNSNGGFALNYFLNNYKFAPESYTGLGVENLSEMSKIYPGMKFVNYSGKIFPFLDKKFDWVFSNAVIEHVGDDDAQLLFLNEMMRVSKKVFFTTPNKYFPIDSHTNSIFLHYNESIFYKWRKKKGFSKNRYDIYLLSYHCLKNLLRNSNATFFKIKKNRIFGIPMTFTIICTDISSESLDLDW